MFTFTRFCSFLLASCLLLSLSSCSTYFQKTRLVQEYFQENKFQDAIKVIDNTNFYLQPKNEFLYHVETGTLEFFAKNYDKANAHFNAADYFEEDYDTRGNAIKDATKEVLLNSAASTYKGEFFERFMLHYYKILSYIDLGKDDEARVEARRLELRLQQLHDLSENKNKKYTTDAFMHIMQGIVYEKIKEYNNAFIAYRNAYEIYVNQNKDSAQLDAQLPSSLRTDLLRMAKYSGFNDEFDTWKREWQITDEEIFPTSDYEAIIFWENGLVPVKAQRNFIFAAIPFNGTTVLYCSAINLILPIPAIDMKGFSTSDLGILRIAFPKLVKRATLLQSATLIRSDTVHHKLHTDEFPLTPITDIEALAFRSLKDRRAHDLSIALTRAMVTKITELSLRVAGTQMGQSSNSSTRAAGTGMQLAGLLAGVIGFAKEKADTRSWLTLPSKINYTRVALKKGVNNLKMVFVDINGQKTEQQFTINCEQPGLYLHNIRTPMALPPDPLALDKSAL